VSKTLGVYWWYCRRCRRQQIVTGTLPRGRRARCSVCAGSCHWQVRPDKSELAAGSYQPSLFE
jgi:hypothetical protein